MQERTYPGKRIKTRYPGVYYREGVDGKRTYLIVYRDSDGRQRTKNVGPRQEDALAALDNIKGRKRKGERVAPSSMSLREMTEEWLRQEDDLRRSTKVTYRSNLNKHIYPRLGHRRISDIDVHDIADFVSAMKRAGYSGHTIHGMLTPLSGAFEYAIDRGA